MARSILQSSTFGGGGGSAWDDNILTKSPAIVGIHKVDIRHGDQVDSLQVTYRLADGSTYTAPSHGGTGGSFSSFTLASNERIVRVEGKTDSTVVDRVTFVTKNDVGEEKKYGPFGKTGRTPFSVEGYIVGFFGRSGNLLDALGVYYLPQLQKSSLFGGSGGNAFVDPVDVNIPPVVKVKSMKIRHSNQVNCIDVDYLLLGGGVLDGETHGGSGGSSTIVDLADDEVIVKMAGKTNNTLVDQFTLTTTRPDGTTATYGPLGKTGKTEFEVQGNIVGFFGRSGDFLDAVGAFYC